MALNAHDQALEQFCYKFMEQATASNSSVALKAAAKYLLIASIALQHFLSSLEASHRASGHAPPGYTTRPLNNLPFQTELARHYQHYAPYPA